MNKEKILENLETKKIGRNFLYYEEVDSTQKYAKRLAEESVIEGTTIYADYQTAGIGTHNRKWYSEKGKNIAFTFLLYPNCNIKQLENLTLEIAEKIIEAIYELYKIKLDIKKPNDLIINEKKVGGILTETQISGETVKKLFVGIGINVHQTTFDNKICKIATSLQKEYPKTKFEIEAIVAKILNKLEKIYEEKI